MKKLTRQLFVGLVALLLAAFSLAACGSDSDDAASGEALDISGAWARSSPMMATAGAAYMQITSDSGDRLVSASVSSDVAGSVEIHEVVPVEGGDHMDGDMGGDSDMDGDSDMSGDMDDDSDMSGDMDGDSDMSGDMHDDSGMHDMAMTMQELEGGLELPAGETVTLQPGGYHIMLLDLPDPLEVGEVFDIELSLESGATQTVSVEVRESAP